MTTTRLVRPNQTWALAYENAFANPATPTTTELNDGRFVHLISCALDESGTELSLGNSQVDNTVTFCDIGEYKLPTFNKISAKLTWLTDANTGGSGSTVDLTSLYNKTTALLDYPDQKFWIISRTGPNASQDIPFAVGHVIKMALVQTDYPVWALAVNTPIKKAQTPLYKGQSNWNYSLAA